MTMARSSSNQTYSTYSMVYGREVSVANLRHRTEACGQAVVAVRSESDE